MVAAPGIARESALAFAARAGGARRKDHAGYRIARRARSRRGPATACAREPRAGAGEEPLQRAAEAALRQTHARAVRLQSDADHRVLRLRLVGAESADREGHS